MVSSVQRESTGAGLVVRMSAAVSATNRVQPSPPKRAAMVVQASAGSASIVSASLVRRSARLVTRVRPACWVNSAKGVQDEVVGFAAWWPIEREEFIGPRSRRPYVDDEG